MIDSAWSWLDGSGLSIIVLASVLVAGGLIAIVIIFIKRKKINNNLINNKNSTWHVSPMEEIDTRRDR